MEDDKHETPDRLPNSVFAEFSHNGELIFRIEQKPPRESSGREIAASVIALRELADGVENWLDEAAEEVVDPDEVEFEDHDLPE